MTNLVTIEDWLPPPQFPDFFTEQDRQMILLALASAKQQVRQYGGKFEAPWLLSDFEAPVWETTNRGREELVEGYWHNAARINWRVMLPNHLLLTDARYERLLKLAKKIAFFTRSNLVAGKSAPVPWKEAIGILINVIRWVVLHEEKFRPEQFGLQLLDQAALDWLFGLLAEGGWTHALQIPQRILSTMYLGAHCVAIPQHLLDNPCTIPHKEIGALVRWLEHQKCYKQVPNGTHFGKRYISRGWFARRISDNVASFKSLYLSRFFRQFEPDFSNESLHISLGQSTEFPSQKTKSIYDVSGFAGEASVDSTAKVFVTILDAHRHLPDILPEPGNISLRRATSIAKRVARPSTHTLFMPIDIGLDYLNTAMRFVQLYGNAIVGFYLAVIADYKPNSRNVDMNKSLSLRMNDWCIASGEPIASILNITEFRRSEVKPNFGQLRSNPTLDQALRVLIGSCIVCMALLKPSRDDELTHLKRNCLREYAGGYWFNFNLGKSNTCETWQDEDRPIPVITAKAIHLLQSLGGGLSKRLAENRKVGDNLFYLPKSEAMGAMAASNTLLNNHLDIFCDFVGLLPDREGRRWYVRIHEMRKWFLLLLFWSGRFDVLDAARWIAGHTDAQHTYAYIENEFPGEELPRLEAEYSIDRIYRRDQERVRGKGDAGNEDSVDALYGAVLRRFNVESLTMVPESEWIGYVQSLRKDEKFRLEPHSICGENGNDVVSIDVSFVMRELH